MKPMRWLGCVLVAVLALPLAALGPGPQPHKAVAMLAGGYATSVNLDDGWSVLWRDLTFFGKGDAYRGYAVSLGTLGHEAWLDAGFVFGSTAIVKQGPTLDVSLDVIVAGGRVDLNTSAFHLEGPALQPVLGLVVPIAGNVEIEFVASPVLRPFDLSTGTWSFSGTYFTLSGALRWRTYELVETKSWSDAHN